VDVAGGENYLVTCDCGRAAACDKPRSGELNQYYLVSGQAKMISDFKITTTEALVKIEAMLRYARVLVEKCDGVWAVRNDLTVS